MIKSFTIQNLGPIDYFACNDLGKINVIIGENGMGKTQILKALYATTFAVEQYGRGIEHRSVAQLLTDKLYTTFLPNKLGDLVKRNSDRFFLQMQNEREESVSYGFGGFTTSLITEVQSTYSPTDVNSIFIPAKEVISLQQLVKESRSSKFNVFGFDDTYLDLANALVPVQKGRTDDSFLHVRRQLKDAIHGRIEYKEEKNEWIFKDERNREYGIALTSEGVKKMSVMDVLLGNRFLTPGSIVFIDELESALHPKLIAQYVEMLVQLAQADIQFFVSTHSYAVIKKFYIVAHREGLSIPAFSLEADSIASADLMKEMPDNGIVNESIRLYEEEISL